MSDDKEDFEQIDYSRLDGDDNTYTFIQPDLSPWKCYMFGSKDDHGMVYQPVRGAEPNWFQRYMGEIFFGNRWVKT